MVVGTTLVQRFLGTITKDLGFLSLWLGVGMFLGTVIYGRWGALHARRVVLGTAFIGAAVMLAFFVGAVAWLRSGAAASVAALGMGICVGPAGVLANTMVHEAHPERMHGRIFSSLGIVVNLAFIGSMISAGWMAEQLGVVEMLFVVAAVFAFCGLTLLYYKENS
jgi:MFS family permease